MFYDFVYRVFIYAGLTLLFGCVFSFICLFVFVGLMDLFVLSVGAVCFCLVTLAIVCLWLRVLLDGLFGFVVFACCAWVCAIVVVCLFACFFDVFVWIGCLRILLFYCIGGYG